MLLQYMMLQENTSFINQKVIKPVKNVMPLIKSSWKIHLLTKKL